MSGMPPPGPGWSQPPPPPRGPNHSPHGSPGSPYGDSAGTTASDKPLGWIGVGFALAFCVPCLPLVGVVVALVALARRRFRPRWAVVAAIVAGLAFTGLQIAAIPTIWAGLQDGVNESLEQEADDARASGEAREITPAKLRKHDCLDDPATKGTTTEQVEVSTVTLLPCSRMHDIEVYATFTVDAKDYPGQAGIDKAVERCFPSFEKFVGKPYGQSRYEVFFYFPTKQSWRILGDRTITCAVGHPERKVRGSLENARR